MRKYLDLIYYKQDIVDEYTIKRKALEKKDVEDLLRCALLYLEEESKNKNITSIEVPNIGFLHKKIDFNRFEESKDISFEDNLIAECAYIDTKFLPISMRKDMLYTYYPGMSKNEIQVIQNSK